jgi:hypothetical protein
MQIWLHDVQETNPTTDVGVTRHPSVEWKEKAESLPK